MDVLVTLGRTLGFSLAAGVNLYATVALVGLAARFGWVALPEQFQVFNNPWVIGLASACCTWSSSSPTRFRGWTRCGMRSTRSSGRSAGR